MLIVYGIKIDDTDKFYNFKSDEELEINDLVIVNTDRGENLGKVLKKQEKNLDYSLEMVVRKATDDEYQGYLKNLKDAVEALKTAKEIVLELGLDMHIVNASFNLNRSQLLFNFTADARVDFRDLAKKLAGIYRTRIELRQIGARDKAKSISGIGVCGSQLCCVRFLKSMNTISMNMAKNQNLALNPSKINGSCGRLLCCLEYEDDNYIESSKGLPSVGDFIKTPKGEGQVASIDVLNRKCKVMIDGEKIEYEFDSKK